MVHVLAGAELVADADHTDTSGSRSTVVAVLDLVVVMEEARLEETSGSRSTVVALLELVVTEGARLEETSGSCFTVGLDLVVTEVRGLEESSEGVGARVASFFTGFVYTPSSSNFIVSRFRL